MYIVHKKSPEACCLLPEIFLLHIFCFLFSSCHQSANSSCFFCRKTFPAAFQTLSRSPSSSANFVFHVLFSGKLPLQIFFNFFVAVHLSTPPFLLEYGQKFRIYTCDFGIIMAQRKYARIPAPQKQLKITHIIRISVGSMLKYSAIPPHTPQIIQFTSDLYKRLFSIIIPPRNQC